MKREFEIFSIDDIVTKPELWELRDVTICRAYIRAKRENPDYSKNGLYEEVTKLTGWSRSVIISAVRVLDKKGGKK